MRAQKLFVITVGYDTSGELVKGAKALTQRLLLNGHAPSVSLVHVSKYTDRFGWKYIRGAAEDTSSLATEEDVGVYVVGHHGREISGVGDFTAEDLAGALIAMGFKHTRKLCILACNITIDGKDSLGKQLKLEKSQLGQAEYLKDKNPTKAAEAVGKADKAQQTAQRMYLGLLSKHLAAAGMKPKIAGWDSFVTICYAKSPLAKKPAKDLHLDLASDANKGRKVISPHTSKSPQYGFASPKNAEETLAGPAKVVIQWEGDATTGRVVAISPEGWSDRNRLTQ